MLEKYMILAQYSKVFDKDGNILACGRLETKKLIEYMTLKFPNVDFGNYETGMMNVEKIKEYIEKL